MSASYYGRIAAGTMVEVTEELSGCHPLHLTYPLLPGDLLCEQDDGTFYKFGPGLGITGFVLTDEQRATLKPCEDTTFGMGGVDYFFASARVDGRDGE